MFGGLICAFYFDHAGLDYHIVSGVFERVLILFFEILIVS